VPALPEIPWIGVDLDGTLAEYTPGNYHAGVIGKPLAPMVERVKAWLGAGLTVKIFTARVGPGTPPHMLQAFTEAIEPWCIEHIGQPLEVTATKDYLMTELWDDRAVGVEFNTGKVRLPSPHLEPRGGI